MNQNVCVLKKVVKVVVFQMIDTVKNILETAIKEEEYFYEFYKKLAEKATDEEMKKELNELAEYEKMHKEKLETLNFNEIGAKVIPEKLEKIDIGEELNLPDIDEFLDMRTMIEFAIKNEVKAKVMYKLLADSIDDESASNLLNKLSEEEAMHEQVLKEKLEKIKGGSND
ncbi:ferritin family protein [Nanoarchaeota archaeon]